MNRKDAKRVKDITSSSQILIDLKPNRCDSDVFINTDVDVTKLVSYIENHKKDEVKLTYFHAFVAAFAKTIYNRPKLNYFVANRHVYEHNNVVISFVAKVDFNDKSEELMLLVPVEPDDTIFTIRDKIKDKVDSVRKRKDKKKGANSAVDIVAKLPNIIRIPVMGILKYMDRHGILPNSLINDNLYYSSAIVSNLGSIKCGAIYHNITNFGTASSLVTMGEIKDKKVIIDSKEVVRKFCEFGINMDERVADGYYFSKSIKLLEYLLDNPTMLEKPMKELVNLEEIR